MKFHKDHDFNESDHPRNRYGEFTSKTSSINPNNIEPPHGVRDKEKRDNLAEIMREEGWKGRPILAATFGGLLQGLTGSHRIAAARKAEIEAEVYEVSEEIADFVDKEGLTIADIPLDDMDRLAEFFEEFGDPLAAKLARLEKEANEAEEGSPTTADHVAPAEVKEKITRATFLYLDPRNPEDKFAQCATCVHFIRDKGLCEWFSKDDKINPRKSCGFYVPGENAVGKEPLNLVTPEEAGLVEREVRCENCVFFDAKTEPRKHCDFYTQLNLILPGVFNLDRYVDEYGCCNAQTPGKRNPEVFGPFGPIKHGNEMTGDSKKITRDFAGYYAPEKIGKTRRVTPEGFLVLEGTPIARTGEQVYNAHELDGITPAGNGQIIVTRLPEEVFKPETLQSFEGKDFVIEHPPDGVDVENWKNHTVGHVQNVRRGTGIEDDLIVADIIVKDPMAIEYVNKHLPEISAGYNADYEQTEPGKAIQRNIIGNHVAGVKAGRAGARVAVRDHQTDTGDFQMSSKTNKPVLRAVMAALGFKTEDAARVETAITAVETTDASEESEGKYSELAKDMKAVKDWMAARDSEREEEKKAKDKAAKDAEAAARKKEEEEEESEKAEQTGDTVLEAEGPGHVINLGKTWTGSMTGDSAVAEPVLAAVIARAEILAPGITKPTADSIKGNKGTALASFMRQALKQHATGDGVANVQPFLMGDSVETLKGQKLVGVFNGAAQLARARNNQRSSVIQRRTTGDFSPAGNIAEMNKRAREFWAKK